MLSVMEWVQQFHAQALRDDDKERLRLVEFYHQARALEREQHEQRLEICRAGGELARKIGEPWWMMFYEYWKISTLLYHQPQVPVALDLATRAVLEVAKPLYEGFPMRSHLNLLLVSIYMKIDPIWHESRIRATFSYLREHDARRGFLTSLAQQWTHFLDVIDDQDASAAAWQYLKLADEIGSEHCRTDALLLLCELLWRCEPQTAHAMSGDFAAQAETLAAKLKNDHDLANALIWRAVAARRDGDPSAASELYWRAFAVQNRMNTPRIAASCGAIFYHEMSEEWDEALRVAQNELRVLRAHKLTFSEAKLRFKKCELLKRAGRDWSREAARLRAVAARLPSEAHWSNKLAKLASD